MISFTQSFHTQLHKSTFNHQITNHNHFCLQIISDYCKNVHQAKPFSHIMMELFKRVVQDPKFNPFTQKDEKYNKNQRNQLINLKAKHSDGHK